MSLRDRRNRSVPSAVLWDLDGTLADSEEYHWLSWRDAMRGEGFALTHDRFLESFGQRNDRILGTWLGANAEVERIRRIGDWKEAEYRRLAEERGLTPLPGAREWVARLRDQAWRQAIASSAPRQNIDVMLELIGLSGAFDVIVSAEDVTLGKPDPQVFLTAADRLGVPAPHAIVVEDAQAGVLAGRRAGMKVIGVGAEALEGADRQVRSLADLPADAFEVLVAG